MPAKIHHKQRRPARVFLKEWLEYRHLTAERLAGRLDTSKSVISKLMNGHQRYNQDWLEQIAWALDCEVYQLYRPPETPTADELLSQMQPDVRETAMRVLLDMSSWKTGTND